MLSHCKTLLWSKVMRWEVASLGLPLSLLLSLMCAMSTKQLYGAEENVPESSLWGWPAVKGSKWPRKWKWRQHQELQVLRQGADRKEVAWRKEKQPSVLSLANTCWSFESGLSKVRPIWGSLCGDSWGFCDYRWGEGGMGQTIVLSKSHSQWPLKYFCS